MGRLALECAGAPSGTIQRAPGAQSSASTEPLARWTTSGMDGLPAAQSSWLDVARILPAAMLAPFGWRLKRPAAPDRHAAEVANGAFGAPRRGSGPWDASTPFPLAPRTEAWKPAHTEEFAA